jgi:hypothetical protein
MATRYFKYVEPAIRDFGSVVVTVISPTEKVVKVTDDAVDTSKWSPELTAITASEYTSKGGL